MSAFDNLESNMRVFDAALAKLMPADMAEKYRRESEALKAKNAALAEKVRCECAEALELLGSVIRRPNVGRVDLVSAIGHLMTAHNAIAVLDPEE